MNFLVKGVIVSPDNDLDSEMKKASVWLGMKTEFQSVVWSVWYGRDAEYVSAAGMAGNIWKI